MKLKLVTLATLLFLCCAGVFCTEAFAKAPTLKPECQKTGFKYCGYTNGQTDLFVIEPKFEIARKFSEGLAAVRIDGLYGYIDHTGNLTVPARFTRAGEFDQGLAIVKQDGKLGVIDANGIVVVPPRFHSATVFTKHVLVARDARPNTNKHYISPSAYGDFGTGAGLYHIQHGWLTEQFHHFDVFTKDKREIIQAVIVNDGKGTSGKKYGLMRADGSWLVKPKYNYIRQLSEDRAEVRILKDGKSVSGAINGRGELVIPFEFDFISYFEDGFALTNLGPYPSKKHGVINKSGKLLGNRYFDEVELYGREPGQAPVEYIMVKDGDEWKSLLPDGNVVSDRRVGKNFLDCDGFTILHDSNGYTMKPKSKKYPKVFGDEVLSRFSNQKCEQVTLIKGKTYAQIMPNGKIFGKKFFDNSLYIGEDFSWVQIEGKWGVINEDGEFEIEPTYKQIETISSHDEHQRQEYDFKAYINDTAYLLSRKDGEFSELPFSAHQEDYANKLNCDGKVRRESKDGLWGLVDKNNKVVISKRFRAITCFSSGLAWVPDDQRQQWCPIGPDGAFRNAPACQTTYYPRWTSHTYPEVFNDDPYENSVLWTRAYLDYAAGKRTEEPKMIPDGVGG